MLMSHVFFDDPNFESLRKNRLITPHPDKAILFCDFWSKSIDLLVSETRVAPGAGFQGVASQDLKSKILQPTQFTIAH